MAKQLSQEVSTLVRQEIALARVEMTEKGKRAGIGVGMFGAAGAIGLAALGAFTAFAILVLDSFMPNWLAALVVTIVWAAVAGVLAMRGREEVKEAGSPVPEQTKETLKEDVQWAKTQIRSDRKS
jgi:nitrate/nitrite transporter NarK